jgi:histidinol dehydrogenase
MAGSSVSAGRPMPLELDSGAKDFAAAFAKFLAAKRELAADVDAAVAAIIDDVRTRGDVALIEQTKRLDKLALTPATLRVTDAEIDAAVKQCKQPALEALRFAKARIEDYHKKQLPADLEYTDASGVKLGWRYRPISAVGLYVPGGTAAYPSSVLMNAVPAKVAGVGRIAMVVPSPGGVLNPLVLAAAQIAGIGEIYRVGGAQAVAALAYGTATIAPVDKITGPGNAYVAAAKRRVFGTVGIDMIAGPSEVLVIADRNNDPQWIAADLLAQAEHDAAAQSILITDDRGFANAVGEAVTRQLTQLPRGTIGRYTPEAVGDYVAGPNHVLPTARSARFASGLGVLDFMKRTSLLRCDAASLKAIGPAAITLAEAEGLDAHARSVSVRLNLGGG